MGPVESSGWLHLGQAPSHSDSAIGSRALSIAVVEDGVVFTVSRNGLPASCTISFNDFDLLLYFVEHAREDEQSLD